MLAPPTLIYVCVKCNYILMISNHPTLFTIENKIRIFHSRFAQVGAMI
jgi:hypothetical protein